MALPGAEAPSAGHHGPGSPPALVAAVVILVPAWRLDRTFDYAVTDPLSGVRPGSLVRVPFGGRSVRGVVVGLQPGAGEELSPIKAVLGPHPVAPPPLDDLYRWVARRYLTPLGRAFERAAPPRTRIRPSEPGDPVPEVRPSVVPGLSGGPDLLAAVGGGKASTWMFRRVPGDDRAGAIADLVGAAVGGGRAALVAVPEVHHGSLLLEGLARRFPDLERVDSAMDPMGRSRAWFDLSAGALVGAGGRGVVFAPSPRLGLIVIDDEHHVTYKEDRAPRYDARRVAVQRAELQGAVCVLMSATPSVETGEGALSGTYRSVEPDRASERRARPIVELVARPHERALSQDLHERIRDTLRAGQRVALLAPARGYARAIWCAGCRRSLRCSSCEAGMFLDRSPRRARCPRCDRSMPAPEVCAHCGGSSFRYMGAGSERLAEQIASSFPRARVARMDPAALTEEPPPGDIPDPDIYVTTWVGTKEAIRPDVSLVGILDADALIRRPDFRAAERAYQAFVELAGWAGPASDGGRLLVQTAEPSHHSLQALVRSDYRYFLQRELEERKELGYPPFSELIKVTASGPAAGELVERVVATIAPHGVSVLGPVKLPPGSRVPGAEEGALQVLLKCPPGGSVAEDLRGILLATPAGSRLRVDVDPR
ncbi:MAG: primosomal protein N' [Actinomycetota bacterium]|nr:primosomal protein N' [Actinomycetota bacterium]